MKKIKRGVLTLVLALFGAMAVPAMAFANGVDGGVSGNGDSPNPQSWEEQVPEEIQMSQHQAALTEAQQFKEYCKNSFHAYPNQGEVEEFCGEEAFHYFEAMWAHKSTAEAARQGYNVQVSPVPNRDFHVERVSQRLYPPQPPPTC